MWRNLLKCPSRFATSNIPITPVENTCVFAAFQASDSAINLHIAFDRYKDQVNDLKRHKVEVYIYVKGLINTYCNTNTLYNCVGDKVTTP